MRLSGFLSGLFALLLLVAMGLGIYYLFDWILDYFRGLDPQLLSIVIAVLFGLVLLALLLRWSRKQDLEAHLRMEKKPIDFTSYVLIEYLHFLFMRVFLFKFEMKRS